MAGNSPEEREQAIPRYRYASPTRDYYYAKITPGRHFGWMLHLWLPTDHPEYKRRWGYNEGMWSSEGLVVNRWYWRHKTAQKKEKRALRKWRKKATQWNRALTHRYQY